MNRFMIHRFARSTRDAAKHFMAIRAIRERGILVEILLRFLPLSPLLSENGWLDRGPGSKMCLRGERSRIR